MIRPAAIAIFLCLIVFAAACSSKPLVIENEPALIQGARFTSAEEAKLAAIEAILATPDMNERFGEHPAIERRISEGTIASSKPLGRTRKETQIETIRIAANNHSAVVSLTVLSQGSGEWGLSEWTFIERSYEPSPTG